MTTAVQKLIIYKFSLLAIPSGTQSGLADGISVLTDPDKYRSLMQEAKTWVSDVIATVKTAPSYPGWTDEEIAQAILDRIEARKRDSLPR